MGFRIKFVDSLLQKYQNKEIAYEVIQQHLKQRDDRKNFVTKEEWDGIPNDKKEEWIKAALELSRKLNIADDGSATTKVIGEQVNRLFKENNQKTTKMKARSLFYDTIKNQNGIEELRRTNSRSRDQWIRSELEKLRKNKYDIIQAEQEQ